MIMYIEGAWMEIDATQDKVELRRLCGQQVTYQIYLNFSKGLM